MEKTDNAYERLTAEQARSLRRLPLSGKADVMRKKWITRMLRNTPEHLPPVVYDKTTRTILFGRNFADIFVEMTDGGRLSSDSTLKALALPWVGQNDDGSLWERAMLLQRQNGSWFTLSDNPGAWGVTDADRLSEDRHKYEAWCMSSPFTTYMTDILYVDPLATSMPFMGLAFMPPELRNKIHCWLMLGKHLRITDEQYDTAEMIRNEFASIVKAAKDPHKPFAYDRLHDNSLGYADFRYTHPEIDFTTYLAQGIIPNIQRIIDGFSCMKANELTTLFEEIIP